MGIFNRSIPTYTVDTANKLRVTKPLVEEPTPQPYIDDIFDPILNKNVRDSLLKRWGNPITATAVGYLDLIDNALVGNNEQWGILGPGMGVLGTFGRSMDKAGDFIIGGITEGVKGVTGQGMSNPLYQVFVEDKDYTGEKLLAAMGNSMAKMAGAPELTEKDFGGAWKVPSIGLELATDPGIMGGAMAKAGGAVGRLSTAEVLENIGKSGHSPLADVGQLLSNYDDAMAKIAIDVTAPGARSAVKKFMNLFGEGTGHASEASYVNRMTKAATPEEAMDVVREAKADPKLKMQMDMNKAVKEAEQVKYTKDAEIGDALEDVKINASAQPSVTEKKHPVVVEPPKRFAVRKFEPSTKNSTAAMRSEFNGYVDDIRKARDVVIPNTAVPKNNVSSEWNYSKPTHAGGTLPVLSEKGTADKLLYSRIREDISKKEYDKLRAAYGDDFVDSLLDESNVTTVSTVKGLKPTKISDDEMSAGTSDNIITSNNFRQSIESRIDALAAYELKKRTGTTVGRWDTLKTAPEKQSTVRGTVPVHRTSVKKYLKSAYKNLTPDDQLSYLIVHSDYFNKGTKSEISAKQKWFKDETRRLVDILDKKYPVKTLSPTDVARPLEVKIPKPSKAEYDNAHAVIKKVGEGSSKEYAELSALNNQLKELSAMLDDVEQYAEHGWIDSNLYTDVRDEYETLLDIYNSKKIQLAKKYGDATDDAWKTIEAYDAPDTRYIRPFKERELNAIEKANTPDVQADLKNLHSDLTSVNKMSEVVVDRKTGDIVPFKEMHAPEHPTGRLLETFYNDSRASDTKLFRELYGMSDEDALNTLVEHYTKIERISKYKSDFTNRLADYRERYTRAVDSAAADLKSSPIQNSNAFEYDTETEAVGDVFKKLADDRDIANSYSRMINDEYQLEWDQDTLRNVSKFLKNNDTSVIDEYRALQNMPDGDAYDEALKEFKDRVWKQYRLNLDTVDAIATYRLDTVDGFLKFIEHNVDGNTATYNTIRRLIEPYKQNLSNAPISVSPSILYNSRQKEVLTGAVASVELDLKRILDDYDVFKDASDTKSFWNTVNEDPVLQQLFTPDWRIEQYINDLKIMFKTQGLKLPFDNARLRENFFQEINKYPALKEALGVKRAHIEDFQEVLFGAKPSTRGTHTVQQQLLALDRFTNHVLETIKPSTLNRLSQNANLVKPLIERYGIETVLMHPERIFKKSDLGKYRVFLTADYDTFIRQIRETALALANGDLYSELYRFARRTQADIFEPLKMQFSSSEFGKSVLKGRDFGGLSFADRELRQLTNADGTKVLNDALRKTSSIRSIADARDFALKSHAYTPAEHSATAGTSVNPLNEFLEVKFNNLGKLQLNGSTLPEKIIEASKLRGKKYVPSDVYPVRQYLNGAGTDATELARRENVLRAIVKASKDNPDATIDAILKDVGGVDDDIKRLFNKVDLTPKYVDDVTYNYNKSVGNKLLRENAEEKALRELEQVPPKELVNTPVKTAAEHAVDDVIAQEGLSEVASEVKRISNGGNFEDLTPDQVEHLKTVYGNDAIDLFKIIDDATSTAVRTKTASAVSNSREGNRLAEMSSKLSKDPKSTTKLMAYDMIQTAERGDALDYSRLIDEIVTSDGVVGMHCATLEEVNALKSSLTDFVNTANSQLKFNAFKVHEHSGKHGTFVAVTLDLDNVKKLLKADYSTLKFDDTAKVVFESPKELSGALKKFRASDEYLQYDSFVQETSNYVRDIYSKLGFQYDDVPHVKHVLNDIDPKHAPLIHEFYTGLDIDKLKKVANSLRSNDSLKHLFGTFGATPYGRGLRGSVGRYNFGKYTTFNFHPDRVLSSTLSEGVLSNSNVQGFVGLFVNDNFRIAKNFDSPDVLADTLNAGTANMRNLDVIAPVYDGTGKLIKFHRYNKTSIEDLTRAFKNPDAICVPSAFTAPLDAWCKKNIKMSNKVYRTLNKIFMLPYKFGVLANPGFLLGNVSDAYLKQVATLAKKYGTTVPEEIVNLADSLKEVIHLNNNMSNIYERVIADIETQGVKIPPSERIMEAVVLNPKARKRIVNYLNGDLKGTVSKNPVVCKLTDVEKDTVRVWMYINNFQTTKALGDGVRDISTEMLKEERGGIIERIFFGSKNYNAKKPSTWGVFANNPYISLIFNASEQSEALFRSANILNAMKHDGYSVDGLARILGDGYDPALSKKLHVDTVNAMNVMYNSNFNYDMQSELIHKIGYAVPFPTFFVKNLTYWLEMMLENPQFIDHALTVHEGLWSDRDEDVKEDKFIAEAKGRGSIPISDGDEQGLSKFFKGIYKPTPLNSMFSAFNLINNPIENLTTRVHPMLGGPMQLAQAKLAPEGSVLATEPEDVKYRPYSTNRFEKNVKVDNPEFSSLKYMFHRLNPFDRAIGNTMRLPDKVSSGDVQFSDVIPSVFQPDF